MVFYNLILNGIKFNSNENPEIHISISALQNHWEFKVSDNGIGIPAEYQDQIFEIFKRLHRHNDYEGTGIGLALCKKIVQRHNGDISIKSNDGAGVTFTFTISKKIQSDTNLLLSQKNSSLDKAVKEILDLN